MVDERTICVVCAWRKDCRKKHRYQSSGLRCPDYTRDITLKEDKKPEE